MNCNRLECATMLVKYKVINSFYDNHWKGVKLNAKFKEEVKKSCLKNWHKTMDICLDFAKDFETEAPQFQYSSDVIKIVTNGKAPSV